MGVKEGAVVGLTVIGLLVGANQMLQPKTVQDQGRQIQDQRWDDLSDSQENERDRRRERLPDDLDAERRDRMVPGEHRPPELPRLRLRVP